MSRSHREYDDDDGRTIADMSGVFHPSMFGHRPSSLRRREEHSQEAPQEESENPPFTPKERRMYALGALKAALLIGLAYLVGLGAVIGLLLLIWTIL